MIEAKSLRPRLSPGKRPTQYKLFLIAAPTVGLLLASGGCNELPIEPVLPALAELPADLTEVTFTSVGEPSYPYVLLEIQHPEGFKGFVMVNRKAQPVWFFRTRGGPVGFTLRANGNFVFLDSDRGLVEVTKEGIVAHELTQEPAGRTIHHDLAATKWNSVLFLANEWRISRDTLVNGEAVWEWYPENGSTIKRWSSFDYLDPTRDRASRYRPNDWLHANSLSIGPRGNIVISSHFLNQVISVSPNYQSLEWRLGGTNATILVDDPFSGQHTVREIQIGRILLFDNGFERTVNQYSRAVEYEIYGNQARKVWEWHPDRSNWARVISAAWRQLNGNTFVAFGVPRDMPIGSTGPIEIYEVDAGGKVLWHLELGGKIGAMYRATPLGRF